MHLAVVHRSAPRCVALALFSSTALGGCLPAGIGAHLIFETEHNPVRVIPTGAFEDVTFQGEGVVIRGWLFRAVPPRRGTVIFLHGRNQNRDISVPVAARLVPRGYDVLGYDSRAHGESTGKYSTFGYFEKRDLSRAIDYLGEDRVIVMGVSLGGAVALQAAAEDSRVAGVIAVSSFTTVQQIVRDQVPWIVPTPLVRGSVLSAAERVGIKTDEVDTVRAAGRIRVPVLLVHGAVDDFVASAHSEKIFAALAGPRELVLVDEARHNDVLAHECVWDAIWAWLSPQGGSPSPLRVTTDLVKDAGTGSGSAASFFDEPVSSEPPWPREASRGCRER